ncbi:hypothetical protein Ccrd_022984, partial [Cynara cardunculus var. scolymus]
MRLRRKSLQPKSAEEPSDVPALLIECQHVAVLSPAPFEANERRTLSVNKNFHLERVTELSTEWFRFWNSISSWGFRLEVQVQGRVIEGAQTFRDETPAQGPQFSLGGRTYKDATYLGSWNKGLSTSPPRRAVALLFCMPTERDLHKFPFLSLL